MEKLAIDGGKKTINYILPTVNDISGRNVFDVSTGHAADFSGVVYLGNMPGGVYIIKLETLQFERSALFVNTGR